MGADPPGAGESCALLHLETQGPPNSFLLRPKKTLARYNLESSNAGNQRDLRSKFPAEVTRSQGAAAKWEKQQVLLATRGLKHVSTVGSLVCRELWVSQQSQAPPWHNISPGITSPAFHSLTLCWGSQDTEHRPGGKSRCFLTCSTEPVLGISPQLGFPNSPVQTVQKLFK